jgi:hypothetical protein
VVVVPRDGTRHRIDASAPGFHDEVVLVEEDGESRDVALRRKPVPPPKPAAKPKRPHKKRPPGPLMP